MFQQLTNAKDYQRTYETQLACKLIQNNFLKKEFEQRYFTLLKHIYVRNLQQIKIIYEESWKKPATPWKKLKRILFAFDYNIWALFEHFS